MATVAELLADELLEAALKLEAEPSDTHPLHEALLSSPRVVLAIHAFAPTVAPLALLTSLSIAIARSVLPIWESAYPNELAPAQAVQAAEAWAACPCDDHANRAAEHMPAAVDAFASAWSRTPREPAWAARTAAWAADAPKYHWQAVPAMFGACRAAGRKTTRESALRFLNRVDHDRMR